MRAYNIYLGKFLDWFLATKLWAKIGMFCAKTTTRFQDYVSFPIDDYFKIVDMIDPSNYYIFLTTDTKTLSATLIKTLVSTTGKKGLFSHGGLILFDGYKNTKAMHVDHNGFQYQSLLSHLKEVDYLAVIKIPVKDENKEKVNNRIENLKERAKYIQYDWAEKLDNGENKIYCTEELYMIFKDLVDNPKFQPRQIANRLVFDPDSLLEMDLEIIYCNHPDFSPGYTATNISQ